MAELWYHDGTAPRKAKELYYHDGVAVRKAKEVWYHDGTAPRKVYTGLQPFLTTGQAINGGSSAQFVFQANGTLQPQDDSGLLPAVTGQWLTGVGDASDGALYEIFFTYVSGTLTTTGTNNAGRTTKGGTAFGSWFNLGTGRSISLVAQAGIVSGTASGQTVFDVSIRLAATGVVMATGRFTLNVSV